MHADDLDLAQTGHAEHGAGHAEDPGDRAGRAQRPPGVYAAATDAVLDREHAMPQQPAKPARPQPRRHLRRQLLEGDHVGPQTADQLDHAAGTGLAAVEVHREDAQGGSARRRLRPAREGPRREHGEQREGGESGAHGRRPPAEERRRGGGHRRRRRGVRREGEQRDQRETRVEAEQPDRGPGDPGSHHRPGEDRAGPRAQWRSARRSSAKRRSSAVVTFRLSAGAAWTRTLPPAFSTIIASSVAALRSAASAASRSAAERNACGVCTAQSAERSSVRSTALPSPTCLIVSVTGAAATTPSASSSASSAPTTASISPAVTSGRAASWTTTSSVSTASNASATDCERVSPPATTAAPPASRPPASSGGAAMTTAPMVLAAANASSDHWSIGRPPSGTSAFGPPAPSLSPEPAAAIRAVARAARLIGPRGSAPWCAYAVAAKRSSSSPSRYSSAPSSSLSRAYMNSEARIFFARVYICFSPVERPFCISRMARLRTTSSSSKTSPVLIFSRLCLNRRFQFFGISETSSVNTAMTFLT